MKAAGIMFIGPNEEVLFLKRSAEGDREGEWAFPGGKLEEGETLEQCAVRECREELGGLPPGQRDAGTTHEVNGVEFTTFRQKSPLFVPSLNDEHTAFAWAKPEDAPQPLHPGVKKLLGLDENDDYDRYGYGEGDLEFIPAPDEEIEEIDEKDIGETLVELEIEE